MFIKGQEGGKASNMRQEGRGRIMLGRCVYKKRHMKKSKTRHDDEASMRRRGVEDSRFIDADATLFVSLPTNALMP